MLRSKVIIKAALLVVGDMVYAELYKLVIQGTAEGS
jgi:hypothetical protein